MSAASMRTAPVRVLFVGSSSVEPTSALPAALAAELGLRTGEWIALGRRGSRLADWAVPSIPAGLRAKAIAVLLTGNDASPRAEQVAAVDRALRAYAPLVVWLPPLPYAAASRVAGSDRRMRDALAAARVARVDANVRLEAGHWASDRVHLTRRGCEAYARQVGPALRQVLELRDVATRPAIGSTNATNDSVIGTLVTPRGERLPLTSTDALWMARALVGEGGGEADASAITSTMLRRWAQLWDAGQRAFRSLADLVVGRFAGREPYEGDHGAVEVRGYSQPVAVQWRDRGENLERRRRVRSLAWDVIEPYRRAVVLRLFTGRAPLTAIDAVHFAERRVVDAGRRRNADWQIVPVPDALNVFVSTAGSRRAREPRVIGSDQARSIVPPNVSALGRPIVARLEQLARPQAVVWAAVILGALTGAAWLAREAGDLRTAEAR